MSVQVRRRRETAAFLSTFVGAQGELIVDTTNNRVQVHDGSTPGGFAAAKLGEVVTNTRTAVSDAAYTALASDRNIALTALTAARTITLPSASTFPAGTQLLVFDESGQCSAANVITIAAVGSDKINGSASATIASAFGYLAFESNSAGKWTVTDQTASATSPNAMRTTVADANYTALVNDRTIAYTALTAARTVSLPTAASFPTGTRLLVLDETGNASGANTITLAVAGSDTINGGTAAAIVSAYGYVAIQTNGTSKWTVVDAPGGSMAGTVAIANGGTGAASASAARSNLGAAASGSNSDISALSGLSTPLSVGQGGTGAATLAVAQANLGAGAANGLATLDASSKLPAAQLPASVAGAMVYQTTWNASTNSPALTSGTGTKGYFYKVAVAGSTTLDGISQWNVGDQAIFDGTTWDKIDGIASEVLSVAGRTGAVTLAATDVSGVATSGANSNITQLTGLTTPLGIGQGGTGVAALRTAIADAAYTALATDRTIAFTSVTAARIVALPAAAAYPTGTQLVVVDESGACSATNTITLARAGSDTINGATNAVLTMAFGYLALVSNGSAKWTIVDQSTASMAQQSSSAVAITDGAINGTTIGATTAAAGTFTSASFGSSAGTAGTPNKIGLFGAPGSTGSFGFGISNSSLDITTGGPGNFVSIYHNSGTLLHRISGTVGATYLLSLDTTPIGATTPSTVKGTVVAATTSLNLPTYTVAALPAAGTAGRVVYCTNARMQTSTAGSLEASGSGTGGVVTDNGTAWKIAGTNINVSA